MTVRDFYRNVLIELNKEEASSLYVEDFLYFANKAVNEYVNARYNLYDISQQLGDDLRALRKGPERVVENCSDKCSFSLTSLDYAYRHLLNCIITTTITTPSFGCDQKPGVPTKYAAKRLTSDRKASILNNAFLEPKFYRPYFDLLGDNLIIHTGNDNENYNIDYIEIEYLKDPKELELTVEQLLKVEDTSDKMEFPKYVNYEIIKVAVKLILEQGSNPRLSSNPQVNQSIGPFNQSK